MNRVLKRIFAVSIYFLFWIILYSIFYSIVYYDRSVVLLPQYKMGHNFVIAFTAFTKFLPALEITAIVILFTISASRRSIFQLKRYSSVTSALINKLFVLCIIASLVNIAISEIVRPLLTNTKNSYEILSQKYYENINNASIAINREDYRSADQYVNMALLIWEDNQQALSMKEQITSLKSNNTHYITEAQATKINKFVTLPENLEAKEILSMAKTRATMLDFYTANYYANLVLQIADDEQLKNNALALQALCVEKIGAGISADEMLKTQKQFEAKKMAYNALTQKDYVKAYYSFLQLHNDLLNDGNKYDPDIEKYLETSKQKLSEEIFFIEELNDVQTFNSGYSIQFDMKDKKAHFNIGSFYFHSSKEGFDIHLSNVLYSTYNSDGSLISQIKFPYAKIIEKKLDGNSQLCMLVSGISKYNPLENLDSLHSPINLKMSLDDFNLITLAHKGTSAMTISDLYSFALIANEYGFDKYVYQAELCIRFADFFLFVIFTICFAIIAFNLRPASIDKCTKLLLFACLVFPYPLYVLFEIVRYIFKLLTTLLINTVFLFPNAVAIMLLVVALIIATSFLYKIGYE